MSEISKDVDCTNEEKFNNYKEQMVRLKKALKSQFYLEAIFIEYAILEDRADAILRYENNSIKEKDGHPASLSKKLNKILNIAKTEKSLANKYIQQETILEILEWKNQRNALIHALMKSKLTTEEIYCIVKRGEELMKEFNNMATSYKRAVERKNRNNS